MSINCLLSPWNTQLSKTAPRPRDARISRRWPSSEFSVNPVTSICGMNLGVCNSRKTAFKAKCVCSLLPVSLYKSAQVLISNPRRKVLSFIMVSELPLGIVNSVLELMDVMVLAKCLFSVCSHSKESNSHGDAQNALTEKIEDTDAVWLSRFTGQDPEVQRATMVCCKSTVNSFHNNELALA